MCHLYTSRPSLLFSVERKGCAFQVSSIVFSSYTFPQPNLLVSQGGILKTKSGKLDPANFDMSQIHQRNFQSLCSLAQLFLDTLAVILRK